MVTHRAAEKSAMRSMELMMTEVKPRVERALGSPAREAAEGAGAR